MAIRLSLASMLIALAVLAAPATSTHAAPPVPGRSAQAAVPESDTDTKAGTPDDSARPTNGEVTPEAEAQSSPLSEERRKVLDKIVTRGKKAKSDKAKSQRSRAESYRREQREALIRRADLEMELIRGQMAQMEWAQRLEAEAQCRQIASAVADACNTEDDGAYGLGLVPVSPGMAGQLVQAHMEASNAQDQAYRRLAESLTASIQMRGRQRGISAGFGSSSPGTPPNGDSPGPSMPSYMPNNRGGLEHQLLSPNQLSQNRTSVEASNAMREAILRYNPQNATRDAILRYQPKR